MRRNQKVRNTWLCNNAICIPYDMSYFLIFCGGIRVARHSFRLQKAPTFNAVSCVCACVSVSLYHIFCSDRGMPRVTRTPKVTELKIRTTHCLSRLRFFVSSSLCEHEPTFPRLVICFLAKLNFWSLWFKKPWFARRTSFVLFGYVLKERGMFFVFFSVKYSNVRFVKSESC